MLGQQEKRSKLKTVEEDPSLVDDFVDVEDNMNDAHCSEEEDQKMEEVDDDLDNNQKVLFSFFIIFTVELILTHPY